MVHQYRNNGYNIVLDVNSGAVHVVDELAYEAIAFYEKESAEEIVNQLQDRYPKEEIREVLEDIEELKEQGILFTEDTYKDKIIDFKKRSTVVKALCLHIAHDCNLACQYCFAEEGEYHGRRALMSYEVGKQALDFLIENSGSRRNLEVDFFGGEPLMNWQVVKDLVAYGREQEKLHDKKFRFTLTTNGVLLNDEVMEFANREMSNMVLSIDGRQRVHDKMRPFRNGKGSYELVVPKFQKAAESRNQNNYYVRGTFTRNNLDFSEDVLHLADLGFKQISVEPVVASPEEPYAIREEDIPLICEQYDRLAAEMVKRHGTDQDFNFFHFMIDLTGGPCVYKRLSGCGSGTEYLAVEISIPAISLWAKRSSLWEMYSMGFKIRIFGTNSRAAMCMPRKNAETASPDSTAAAAVRLIHIISMVLSMMPMISGVSCSASVWSVLL